MRCNAAMRLSLALLAATTAFGQFPSPTLTEATTKVSEHVFMTTGFPNVVYVVGDDATLVVDTGLGNGEWRIGGPCRQAIVEGSESYS